MSKQRDDRRSGRPSSKGSGPRGPRRGTSGGPKGAGPARRPRPDGPPNDQERPSGPRRGPQGPRKGPGGPARRGRPDEDRQRSGSGPRAARPYGRPGDERSPRPPRRSKDERVYREGDPKARRPFNKGERSGRFSLPNPANEGLIRLNRYLAQAGVGSRRQADELITSGAVTVNGEVVTKLGTMVKPSDIVHFGGEKLVREQKRYVLINKPKDTITTTEDPQERHTVMHLIAKACSERLYPVGRLDRNTTGVLLLTNDGDLAKKLTHPSHGAEKIYHVTLDKNVAPSHLKELVQGISLEDGPAQADEAEYVSGAESRREVGVKLHMGRNRIVRRMFEALGYTVVKLDRVMFAGLTKKDLQRGHWRHLQEKEVAWLKQIKDPPKGTAAERGGRRLRTSYGNE